MLIWLLVAVAMTVGAEYAGHKWGLARLEFERVMNIWDRALIIMVMSVLRILAVGCVALGLLEWMRVTPRVFP
jgi:hypothetical protein